MSDSWWPHGLQPTGLLHPWDFPGKSTGVGCHCLFLRGSLSSVQSLSHVWLLATPWTAAYRAPPSMGFSRQEHWSGLPLPSPLCPRAWRNSCSLSQWCYLTIASSAAPFSFCLPSFLASGSFPISQFLASSGQSIGASGSASVLSVNSQGWFPLGLTGWISLRSKGLSRVFSSTIVQKHHFFNIQPSLWSYSHSCTRLLEKHSFD